MKYFSESFGFESDDMELVTEDLENVLNMKAEHRFNDSYGGDISSFGKRGVPGGRLILYYNHVGDITGPYDHEEDFPEFGLILSVSQEGDYVDYEPKLRKMERDKPTLIRRESYDSESEEDKILFDLAKERSKSKS